MLHLRAALALALCAAAPTPQASPAQHILMIVIDDLGFSDLGYKAALYNSSGPSFSTPTLDALAATGVKLESYYVHALCSPSRTAFLSGRYALTTGMNAEVIVDGVPDQLPTNIRTLADLLQEAGWATGAFGKMDLGMTSWGCTPNCRGFDRFEGYYGADEDYFTHSTDGGVDLRKDFEPLSAPGVYSTFLLRDAVVDWVANTSARAAPHTFNYVAFQAIHAPQQAPQSLLDGHCTDAFPEDQPIRRIACAQMAGVDAAVAAILDAYKAAGILDGERARPLSPSAPRAVTHSPGPATYDPTTPPLTPRPQTHSWYSQPTMAATLTLAATTTRCGE